MTALDPDPDLLLGFFTPPPPPSKANKTPIASLPASPLPPAGCEKTPWSLITSLMSPSILGGGSEADADDPTDELRVVAEAAFPQGYQFPPMLFNSSPNSSSTSSSPSTSASDGSFSPAASPEEDEARRKWAVSVFADGIKTGVKAAWGYAKMVAASRSAAPRGDGVIDAIMLEGGREEEDYGDDELESGVGSRSGDKSADC